MGVPAQVPSGLSPFRFRSSLLTALAFVAVAVCKADAATPPHAKTKGLPKSRLSGIKQKLTPARLKGKSLT